MIFKEWGCMIHVSIRLIKKINTHKLTSNRLPSGLSTFPISSSCSEKELLWGKTIPSPKHVWTGKNQRNRLSPKTSCILFIVPKWNPRLSCTKLGRKIGALKDSRVVWFLVTRYKWYPNRDITEMQNIPLTKKRNRMWNLKNAWTNIVFSFQTELYRSK